MSRVIQYTVTKRRYRGLTIKTGSIRTKSRNPNWIAWRIMQLNPGFQAATWIGKV